VASESTGHYLPFPGRPPILIVDRSRLLSPFGLHALTVAEKPLRDAKARTARLRPFDKLRVALSNVERRGAARGGGVPASDEPGFGAEPRQ
jgi:hypothetical protein